MTSTSPSNIPDEAVEAAARELATITDPLAKWADQTSNYHHSYRWRTRRILEAAAPHLLSHEREQTRLAHLDAMVNRETKREELAAAWDEGYEKGLVGAVRIDSAPDANPYGKAPDA